MNARQTFALTVLIAAGCAGTPSSRGWNQAAATADDTAAPSHWSIDVGFDESGISIGNTPRWNGLRINARDHGVEWVRGLNLTVWTPHDDSIEQFDGIALGVAPMARRVRGVSLGLIATGSDELTHGMHVATLAAVSEGFVNGPTIAGLAVVGEKLNGITLGGLATVASGTLQGVQGSLLAVVAGDQINGFTAAGLAVVAEADLHGVQAAGLATVSDRSMYGVNFAGLALAAENEIAGINVAGLAIAAGGTEFAQFDPSVPLPKRDTAINGLSAALFRVQAAEIGGVALAGIMNRSNDFHGLGISAYNAVSGHQHGLTVGLFNHAEHLEGLQIGLLNHVPNNPPLLRWLPLFNAPF